MTATVRNGALSYPASAALEPNRRVKLSTGKLAYAGASDEVTLGVTNGRAYAADEMVSVRLDNEPGTVRVFAAAAITVNTVVYAAADGKVDATGTVKVGIALQAAGAAGDLIEILPKNPTAVSDSEGTDNSSFVVDADSSAAKLKLDTNSATGNYTATIVPPNLSGNATITLPAATASLATLALAETLTNKTLTAPVLNTPTVKDLTEVVTATNVITAAETGSVFFLNSATEFVSTLPAPAAGLKFTFVVTAAPSGASYTIVTNSSNNIIKGQVYTLDVNSATDPDFEVSGGDTITLVDAKAVAGDRVDVICDGTNWFAYCFCSVFDAITITTAS